MSKLSVWILTLSVCAWESFASPTFRQVVPADVPADNVDTFNSLAQALSTAPSLAAGAVIQIEPGARPANVSASQLATALGLASFTLRGNLAFDASELPTITIVDAVSVTGTGVRLENLNLLYGPSGSLTANGAGFVFSNNILTDQSTTGGTLALSGPGAVVSSNRLRNLSGVGVTAFIRVLAATGNVISDNQFTAGSAKPLISYETAGTKNDLVERNVFRGAVGNASTTQFEIRAGVTNLTIRQNRFTDTDSSFGAISIANGAQSIVIEANQFEFPKSGTDTLIVSGNGSGGLTTSFTIRGNDFLTPGTDLLISLSSTGSCTAVVEGNRFRGAVGVLIRTNGIAPTDIDLGGGTAGSVGGNDFSFFTSPATATATAISAGTGTETIAAANNVFAGDAEAAVFDQADDGTRFDLDTSNASTGNKAFAAALVSRFLRKPSDTAALQAQLDAGKRRTSVATSVIRSDDALTLVIKQRYLDILLRQPDTDELAAALKALKRATGSEENLIATLFAHPESNQIRGSARALVADLFTQLLRRTPTDAEYLTFGKQASRSRVLATKAVLATTEFRTLRVRQVFDDLLRRVPTDDETKKFLRSSRLSLQASAVAQPDFVGGN